VKPIWKQIYPAIKTAVQNLDSLDSLLHQTVQQISDCYGAEVLLWVDLECGVTSARVYGTLSAMQHWQEMLAQLSAAPSVSMSASIRSASMSADLPRLSRGDVQICHLQAFPDWMQQQQRSPHITQLETGDVIVPIVHPAQAGADGDRTDSSADSRSDSNVLQFVLQLYRPKSPTWGSLAGDSSGAASPPHSNPPAEIDQLPTEKEPLEEPLEESLDDSYDASQYDLSSGDDRFIMSDYIDPFVPFSPKAVSSLRRVGVGFEQMPFRGWKAEELESLEILGSQLGLAYSALYWRQRLEQSRQQAGLIGRITRLINSSLSSMEIVGQIVAELGYGIQCDRSLLINLQMLNSQMLNSQLFQSREWGDEPPLESVQLLAQWDHPERFLLPFSPKLPDSDCWQSIAALFLDGGASHLELSLNQPAPESLQNWLRQSGAQSVLFVPLSIQSEFFGAIALLSYHKPRTFLLDELQTVRQAADQAAIALTNAQNFAQFRDRQEALQQQNQALRMEVMRDELTQLLNRRALERQLEELDAIGKDAGGLCVLVCDVDYFKRINDSYGHLVGDEVLSSLAQRLQHQSRRETPVYRYGGEEFVILLPNASLERTLEVAERLRQVIRLNPIKTKAGLIDVTMSFGVARQAVGDRSTWDVLQRADQALYEAKHQGRDRVESR
jgi:diguanylate cyclase (GGDEF)-like protein